MSRFVWYPSRAIVEEANVTRVMDEYNIKDYREFTLKSVEDLEWFWDEVNVMLNVKWIEDYRVVLDTSRGVEWAKWYRGGLINVVDNILDRHIPGRSGKTAFIWSGEDGSIEIYTYGRLFREVNRLASGLLDMGIGRGDVVATYIPMLPETIIIMLATLRIGAVFQPIFSGFSPEAVSVRLMDAGAKVFFTVDGSLRRGRVINLYEDALEASRRSKTIRRIVVVDRVGLDIDYREDRVVAYKDILGDGGIVEPEPMDPEDPALLLYTSGTTGRPKGAVISHAGAILQPAKEHFFNLDMKDGDILFWVSDIGWMMGPWQIIGAQFHGLTHLIMEGAPDYPMPDRIWALIDEFKVTHLGFSATLVRLLRRYGDTYLEDHDLTSIKAFGNTGEPIDEKSWYWLLERVGEGRAPIINLSGGTEIFGCFVLPSVVMPLKPSTLGYNGLGMDVDVYDDYGRPVRNEVGYLVCKKPAPSMTRGLWGDPERYIETYWSRFRGVWYHGDWALVDDDGYFYILGRADDVIKVAGKRVGPAEIETIANRVEGVAESAAIGVYDELKGEVIHLYVLTRPGVEPTKRLAEEIINRIVGGLGKPFKPERVVFVSDLPRTRSGKIMRRIIKRVAHGEKDLGDISSLENPESIKHVGRPILVYPG